MSATTKIALSLPGAEKKGKFFTFRLKQDLYNEPSEYPAPSKIFSISDIEGNFKAFIHLLLKGRVIDKRLNWTFDDGHLVIVGDCFDRGDQVVECLWLIYSLEEQAKMAGGYVHFILGNHEIMNLNGDWRYVHPKYAKSSKIPYTALYNGNNALWHWLCTKNVMEKIGNTLFVHGGVAEELIKLNMSISEINNTVRPWYSQAGKTFTDPLLKTVFNSELSPFWYRGYYHQQINEEQINASLKYFNVSTIVTGHTITSKIRTFFNGKIINIDTDHASGNSEALLIKKGNFYRLGLNGEKEKIKDADH